MSNKIIITIAREFGSEGHEIGKELSSRLGIPLYDKDLISLSASKMGVDIDTIAKADEVFYNKFVASYMPISLTNQSLCAKVFEIEKSLIHDLAEKGSCIIVGRLADYILKETPNCLRIFIYAPFETRVTMIKNKHNITMDEAKKLVRQMDTARKSYYSYYSNKSWNARDGKDLLLNRGVFGVTECASIIETAVKQLLSNSQN